tara:strand:+ start:397 stop:528 length:132 start_codon:yes stop_codon:yes gene_type:complete
MERELARRILELEDHDLEFILKDLGTEVPEAIEYLKDKLEDII